MEGHDPRYDQQVSEFMDSIDTTFMALRRHPFTRGARADEQSRRQFADLLARSVPVTEVEMVVAAVFRWIARRDRGVFIRTMFEGHYACACQLVDGRMVETGLNVGERFSVEISAEGAIRVGEPRPLSARRGGGGGGGGSGGRRRRRNRRGRRYRVAPAPLPTRTGSRAPAPVLDDVARRDLLDQLDQEVRILARQGPRPVSVASGGRASYLDAAAGRTVAAAAVSGAPAPPALAASPPAPAPAQAASPPAPALAQAPSPPAAAAISGEPTTASKGDAATRTAPATPSIDSSGVPKTTSKGGAAAIASEQLRPDPQPRISLVLRTYPPGTSWADIE